MPETGTNPKEGKTNGMQEIIPKKITPKSKECPRTGPNSTKTKEKIIKSNKDPPKEKLIGFTRKSGLKEVMSRKFWLSSTKGMPDPRNRDSLGTPITPAKGEPEKRRKEILRTRRWNSSRDWKRSRRF